MTGEAGQVPQSPALADSDKAADEICETCSCKVEVGSFRIGGTPTLRDPTGRITSRTYSVGHLFIRYTLADGTRRFYRGGPTWGNKHSGWAGVTEFNGKSRGSGRYRTNQQIAGDSLWGKMSVWGPIINHWGRWEGSYEEQTYNASPQGIVLVAEGPEHCNYHSQFVDLLREIGALSIDYDAPGGPNSNSVVYTVLKRTGLPLRKPGAHNPGWGTDLLIDN